MPFKTITIKSKVYQELIKAKKPVESFSQMFERLLRDKKPDLMKFYGAWILEKGDSEKIYDTLKKERLKFELDWNKRLSKVSQ